MPDLWKTCQVNVNMVLERNSYPQEDSNCAIPFGTTNDNAEQHYFSEKLTVPLVSVADAPIMALNVPGSATHDFCLSL